MKLTNTSFDLEQEITRCWQICDDIKMLEMWAHRDDVSKEKLARLLGELRSLYEIKFETMWNCFEDLHSGVCAYERDNLRDEWDRSEELRWDPPDEYGQVGRFVDTSDKGKR